MKRKRIETSLLTLFAVATISGGCGSDNAKAKREWETESTTAFQAFRDRNYPQAISMYKRALALAQQIDPQGTEVAATNNALALVYLTQKDSKTAEELYRDSRLIMEGIDRRQKLNAQQAEILCDALRGIGNVRHESGNDREAEPFYKEALNVLAPYQIPSKERQIRFEYRSVLKALGRDDEAADVARETDQMVDAEAVPDAQNHARDEANKFSHNAEVAIAAKDMRKAKEDLRMANEYAMKCDDPRFRALVQTHAGMLLFANYELRDAEQYMLAGLRTLREAHCSDKEMFPHLVTLSAIQTRLFKTAESEKAARLSCKIGAANYDKDSPEYASAEQALVSALTFKGEYAEAIPLFEHSYSVIHKQLPVYETPVVMHACWLGNLYWLAGKKDSTQQKIDSLVSELNKQPAKQRVLPGRLLVDYGNECLRNKHKDEAALFFNAALKVLKPAPGADVEIQRAQTQLKALQVPAAT